jgi:hypothetical protein
VRYVFRAWTRIPAVPKLLQNSFALSVFVFCDCGCDCGRDFAVGSGSARSILPVLCWQRQLEFQEQHEHQREGMFSLSERDIFFVSSVFSLL